MATRSNIIVATSSKYRKIYCHWDGYISGNGKILFEHYNSQERAEELVKEGDMSSLEARCDKPEGHNFDSKAPGYTVYYGRDRGEEEVAPRDYDTLAEAIASGVEEFVYLWTGSYWGVWEVEDPDGPPVWRNLGKALKAEPVE
jgi:hypothetical protein